MRKGEVSPSQFKRAREAAGLSVAECAALFGRTSRCVQLWESGKRPIDPVRYNLLLGLPKSEQRGERNERLP